MPPGHVGPLHLPPDWAAFPPQAQPWQWQGHPLLPAAYAHHAQPCKHDGAIAGQPEPNGIGFHNTPNGDYYPGDIIYIFVTIDTGTFPGAVWHTRLKLETGDDDRFAVYESHTAKKVIYKYTVQTGDSSSDLNYNTDSSPYDDSLHWTFGTTWQDNMKITGSGQYDGIQCRLPGQAGVLSDKGNVVVHPYHLLLPQVTNVTAADGAHGAGDRVNITVNFNMEVVTRYGGPGDTPPPALLLDTGGDRISAAEYSSGNDTASFVFGYAVRDGDNADDLAYVNTTALSGTITNRSGYAVDLTLPAPGAHRSLSSTSDIRVDAVDPTVVAVSAPISSAVYGIGGEILVRVIFSEAVRVDGAPGSPPPLLALDTGGGAGRSAAYESGNNTDTLEFAYTVGPGDRTDDLAYAGADALSGSIADAVGNAANLTLPAPGSNGSLSQSSDVLIDPAVPRLIAAGSARDGPDFGALSWSLDVDTIVVGDRTYAAVASHGDHAVQLIRVHENGTLKAADEAIDGNDFDRLRNAEGIEAFRMGAAAYAIAAAPADNGVQLIQIHANGTLEARESLADDGIGGTLELAGASRAAAFNMSGHAHALVAGTNDNGVQLIRIHANGTLEARESLADDGQGGDVRLRGAYGVAVFNLSGAPHALVSGHADDGVQLIRIHANGTLEARESLADDGIGGTLELEGPRDIAAFNLSGRGTHALVASETDNGVQLIQIHANGTLEPRGSAAHGSRGFDRLYDVYGVAAFELGGGGGGAAYAAVASRDEDNVDGGGGVQLIRIRASDGALFAAGSAVDDADGFDHLRGARGIHAFGLDGRLHALVASAEGHAVQLIEMSPASVVRVTSAAADGAYRQGAEINITVAFNAPVRVAEGEEEEEEGGGAPSLRLNSGGSARYHSGSGSAELVFRYAVQEGDLAADLDYAGDRALSDGRGGAIAHEASGIPASLVLPPPGTQSSLGGQKDIAVDTRPPSVELVSASSDGVYGAGRTVEIDVGFDEPVLYSGDPPVLLLNASGAVRAAPYKSGNGTDALTFSYAVWLGDRTDDLGYAGAGALSGSIADAAGNPADLSLPAPGSPGSLSQSSDVLIDHALARPIANGSARADAPGFGALSWSLDVDTIVVGGRTYAAVASHGAHAVQLIHVHENGTLRAAGKAVDGNNFDRLNRAEGIDAFRMGGAAYAIAAAPGSSGVQLIQIHENGTLQAAGSLGENDTHNTDLVLGGASRAAAFNMSGHAHALVAGTSDNGVQLIRIHANGTLEPRNSLAGDGVLGGDIRLDGAYGVAVFNLSGAPHALVSGHADDGVQLIRIHANGTLEARESLADDGIGGTLELEGPRDIAAFNLSGRGTHALVASETDNGVQLIQIHANGTLEPRGSAAHGSRGFDRLYDVYGVAAFELGSGAAYAAVASRDEDNVDGGGGVQLIRIRASDGALLAAGSAVDDAGGFDDLRGARGIHAFGLDGRLHALVASAEGSAVQLMRLSPASVVHVASAAADGAHRQGAEIDITVAFDAPVRVAEGEEEGGAPSLRLNLGAAAEYASGNNTAELVFRYTVLRGQTADDLDYDGAGALRGAGGAAITEAGTGIAANTALPSPGAGRSLGDLREIAVDGVPPRVVSVSYSTPDGAYRAGQDIAVAVAFTEPVSYPGGPPALSLNVSRTAKSAPYESGNGTDTLVFLYTVAPGDRADDLDYTGTDALTGGGIADAAGNAAELSLPAPGSPGSLSASADVRIDTAQPRVLRVWSETPDGAYRAGQNITVAAAFSEPVSYPGGPPALSLNVSRTAKSAPYESGNGTDTLVFLYTVAPGDRADDLAYAGRGALTGGGIADAAGNAAELSLPAPGSPGSLSASADVRIDTAQPRVLRVWSETPDGAYRAGQDIAVAVAFSEPVSYPGGPPALSLNVSRTAKSAPYESGNGTDTLVFLYTVEAGDNAGNLAYAGRGALTGDGIADAAGNAANLSLPAPGGTGSLSDSSNVRIDTASPRVVSVASPNEDGTYNTNEHVNITVAFDEPVLVEGRPRLALRLDAYGGGAAAGAHADYSPGNETAALLFVYSPRPGDRAGGLEYAGTRALSLNGGSVRDAAGNAANLTLPAPGGPGSLGGTRAIAINASGTGVLRVYSPDPDGAYGPGSRINVTVSFSADVSITGSPLLGLNTGGGSAAYASSRGPDVAFRYDVRPGENAAPLDYAGTASLSENGGSITATNGGPITLQLPPPGSPNSLAGSSNITVDTMPPRVKSVAAQGGGGAYGANDTVRILVRFTEPVLVEGGPVLGLDAGAAAPPPAAPALAAYSAGSGTDALAFLYTVRPGDNAERLDYAGTGALSLNGGSVGDAAGNDADLALPAPGNHGSLSNSSNVRIDTAPPRVASVGSPSGDGAYNTRDHVNITVAFDEPVLVEGRPRMELRLDEYGAGAAAAGAHADYSSGSGTAGLLFVYSPHPGDRAADLEYAGASALRPNGGSVRDAAGNDADLALPAPGSGLSLGDLRNIEIDASSAGVRRVYSPDPAGAYGAGSRINVTVSFSADVSVVGSPLLRLNTGGSAAHASSRGPDIALRYEVRPGENAAPLDYAGISALDLGAGAAIVDVGTGRPAVLSLPLPGSPSSLAGSSNITVDTMPPRVESVYSPSRDAAYAAGEAVRIMVRFTEAVFVEGAPALELDVAAGAGRAGAPLPPALAAYSAGSGTDTLAFLYTVRTEDDADRLDYAGTGALSLNGGYVRDAAGNDADLALDPPGSQNSLGGTSRVSLRGAGGPADAAPVTPDAVFTAPNTIRIEYGAPLGPPAGHEGPVYGAVAIWDGSGPGGQAAATAAATAASGLGTAAHTVRFGGAGAAPDQHGEIRLVAGLRGDAPNGTSYALAAGATIPVRPGAEASTLAPPGGAPVVAIDPNSFVRVVDASGGSGGSVGSVRPAIDVTALFVGSPAPGTGARTAEFPAGDAGVRLEAPFAGVLFPPGVAAASVPADGMIELYVSGDRPTAEQVAAALGVDASLVEAVGTVVEVGDSAARISFDMPVRVRLDGQAGGRVFYIDGQAGGGGSGGAAGGVAPIRAACAADDAAAVHAQLGGSGECWLDRGGDKVVHTYHLTRFGTADAPTSLEAMVSGAAAGATVQVPPGTYAEDVLAVDRPMTIEAADPENPPVFTGISRIVVAAASQPATTQAASASAAAGPVVIRGLVFEGTAGVPGGGAAPASITVESPAPGAARAPMPVTIEGNTFRSTCGAAVLAAPTAGGSGAGGAPAPPIEGLTVKNNRFYGIGGSLDRCGGSSGGSSGPPAPADAIVAGRYASGGGNGSAAAAAPQLAGMAVRDNYIFGTTYTGIRIAGADGLAVTGNHIEGVPDDGLRIVQSRNVQVHLNTIVGANQAPRAAAAAGSPHDGAAGAAIEVWSGSDDVEVTLNRISESAGAFFVCAGTCDPGPDAASGTGGGPVPVAAVPVNAAGGGPVPVAAVPVNAAGGASDIRFSHNMLAGSNTGTLIANSAGGELDARANYWPGHAESAAERVSPAEAVLHEPALGGAGPVRIGAVVADGPSSPVRSVDAAVRAAFVLGVHDFNAGQARAGGSVGLEPAVRTAGSPGYAADARAGHASDVAALRSGSSADARMLPVLHNSISSAMALYDASGDAALAAISAMGAAHAHYPFVLDRSGAIAAHGADASLAGGRSDGGDGVGAAAAPELLDFAADAAAAAGGTGVDPGHPNAPWKWRAHESVNPATDAAEPKRSVLALHPGPDGATHTEDDLVFGAGYHQGPGAAHLVVAAGDAAAAASAAAGSGAVVAVSPASTASQLAARDALFRLAPPDALLAGVVIAQALEDRPGAAAPLTIVALNDSASLQSMSLAGELYEIDLQGALPDGVDRIAAVSYNSSSQPPPADGGGGGGAAGGGWAADAAERIREAASPPQGGPAAVVYSGRAGAFAELADALGGQPPPNSRWYSTGDLARAELGSSGPNTAALARAGQLAAVLQHAVPNAEIDAALAAPGVNIVLDESTRGPAYAAYDAPALLGRAMASTPGVPGAPASIARAIDEDVARTHAGALGSPLILDRNGDLVLPIAYAVSAFPAAAGADPAGAWGQLDTRIGERSCGIALAKGALDFGILSLGRYSRPDTQTVINTGTLPYRSVILDPGDWTYASGQTLPASITELRELGRAAAYAGAASGFVVAPGLEPGQDRNVQFRINLTAYQSLPPGEASQTINYLVECRAAAR